MVFALRQGVPRHLITVVTYARWRSVDHQLVTALLIGIRIENMGSFIYRHSRCVEVSRMQSQGLPFFKKDYPMFQLI